MQKCPDLSHSLDTRKIAIIKAQKPRSATFMGGQTQLVTTGTQDLEENPPCNAEDNLRAGLIVIEA